MSHCSSVANLRQLDWSQLHLFCIPRWFNLKDCLTATLSGCLHLRFRLEICYKEIQGDFHLLIVFLQWNSLLGDCLVIVTNKWIQFYQVMLFFLVFSCLQQMGTISYLLPEPVIWEALSLTSRIAFRMLRLFTSWHAVTDCCQYWVFPMWISPQFVRFVSGHSVCAQRQWFIWVRSCTGRLLQHLKLQKVTFPQS
jgi:hypothetical protein